MTSVPVAICRFSDNTFKCLYLKKESLFDHFCSHFWNLHEIYNIPKKRRVSYPNYYRNYCIRKRYLLKRLKGLASAHHSVINMLMGSKHCWSQHGNPIFLFFHNFEINWIGKSPPQSLLKSSDCLLTRWFPITSIPVAICRFSGNKFKRFYPKMVRPFEDFLLYFWNGHEIENILKQKKSILP